MHDVERSIVRLIVGVGVQSTARIQCIRIRVDIEVALHVTADHVYILAQRTGSLLLTIATATNQVNAQVVQNLVVQVQVHRVAVHLRLLIPAWINHGRDRTVVLRTGCTTAHAH